MNPLGTPRLYTRTTLNYSWHTTHTKNTHTILILFKEQVLFIWVAFKVDLTKGGCQIRNWYFEEIEPQTALKKCITLLVRLFYTSQCGSNCTCMACGNHKHTYCDIIYNFTKSSLASVLEIKQMKLQFLLKLQAVVTGTVCLRNSGTEQKQRTTMNFLQRKK